MIHSTAMIHLFRYNYIISKVYTSFNYIHIHIHNDYDTKKNTFNKDVRSIELTHLLFIVIIIIFLSDKIFIQMNKARARKLNTTNKTTNITKNAYFKMVNNKFTRTIFVRF